MEQAATEAQQEGETLVPARGVAAWRFWALVGAGLICFFVLTWDASMHIPWRTFLLLTACAIAADWLLAGGSRDHARYLSAPFLLAAVLLLPPPALALFVGVLCLADWLHKGYSWRVLALEASALSISAAMAGFVNGQIGRALSWPAEGPVPLLGAFGSAAIITVVYRALIAATRRPSGVQSTTTSSLFAIDSVVMQFVVLLLGVPIAVFWTVNPWLILAALAPLVLIRRAVTVPALQKEARTDTKTGLHNMKSFNEALSRELQRAARFGHAVSVLMVDLDLLRQVNNSYGHQAGDAVLRGIADVLVRHVREYDVAARFGGDEFVVLLVECDGDNALQVAERIRKLIESLRFEIPTSLDAVKATVSIGVASFPRHGASMEEIVYQADLAVYRAKLGGRNRVCLASPRNLAAGAEALEQELGPTEEAHSNGAETPDAGVPSASESEAAGGAPTTTALPINRWQRRLGDVPRPLQVLIALVTTLSLAMAIVSVPILLDIDWLGLVSLVLLTLAAEVWGIDDLYGASSFSLSVICILAGAMLFGIPGGVIVGLTAGIARGATRQSQPYKVAFNIAVFILAASLAGSAFRLFGTPLRPDTIPLLVGPALCAAIVYYAVNTSLIATAIGLSSGEHPVKVWREQFRWLLVHYIVLGLLGMFLAVAYTTFGLYGLLAFAAPGVAMRYAIHQYIGNTTEHVAELRRLNAEMQRSNEEMASINADLLNTLAAAIDVRDPYVYGHSTKVADYALAIARELRLTSDMIELIRQAALLHDIGKLGVAEAILNKPAKLDPEEYERVKAHSALGADLLSRMRRLQHLVPAIRHHHEWYNGRGYPDGLAGTEIPIEARILAVCDAIEAMASDRPYHKAMPVGQIVAELQRCAGTQFDPVVVQAFVRVSENHGASLVANSALTVRQREAKTLAPNGDGKPVGPQQSPPTPVSLQEAARAKPAALGHA